MTNLVRRHYHIILAFLASLPVKIAASMNMPWEIDIVPVVARNVQYTLTPAGTLSSVAAYNLPMLEWIHLPAQWLTGDVWWTIVLTLMTFNFLGTVSLYALGTSMFNRRVGIIAAVLFTFSETSISSSYTAWAQLLLPSYYAMLMLCLWLWIKQENGLYLALSGIIATAAFMTHFAAVLLYPAMLVVAVLARAKWQLSGLIAGTIIVVLMFLPYTLFQLERDFVDVKAFATQEVLVSDEVMAYYEQYKPGYSGQPESQITADENPPVEQTAPAPQPDPAPEIRPRWLRAMDYALESPSWTWRAMTIAFQTRTPAITKASPLASDITSIYLMLPVLLLVVSIAHAAYNTVGEFPVYKSLRVTPSGRVLLLASFLLVMIALMLLTRTINNTSYWMGFMSIEFLIAAYAVTLLPHHNQTINIAIILLVLLYAGIQTTERGLRLNQHDNNTFSPYNVSIYRHVENTVDFIAEDWQSEKPVTVSYDILQDVNSLWWTPAWNSIDPFYTMGMNFDFLLDYHHNIQNTNTDPIGTLDPDSADYIVVYTPSLDKFDLENYTQHHFGTIVVLKPLNE